MIDSPSSQSGTVEMECRSTGATMATGIFTDGFIGYPGLAINSLLAGTCEFSLSV
jgi:hypothetical protein